MSDEQHEYYREASKSYDDFHNRGEHDRALHWMASKCCSPASYLEVGCGTGLRLKLAFDTFGHADIFGAGPYIEELQQAILKGIPQDRLIVAKAQSLDFAANHFEIVAMYGILHHIPQREQLIAVKEAVRVALRCVLVSDNNAFGHGSRRVRWIKRAAHKTGLWQPLTLVTTKGKGHYESKADGISYPFNTRAIYDYLLTVSKKVELLQTLGNGQSGDIWNDATHIAMLAWLA